MPAPGLSQSALDIVSSAMRLLHLIDPGEDPTSDEASDGLGVLNQMLDAWQIERLMIFTENISDFPFVADKGAYTLGDGADFNSPRPAKIDSMSIVILSNPLNPLELEIKYTVKESDWQAILLKTIETSFPQFCYDDGGFPNRTLNLWPVPRDLNNLRIYSWQALTQFADLNTAYTFPPGYLEAIRYNLTIRLADEFNGLLGQTTPVIAQQALARIKANNTEIPKLRCDDAVCGGAATGPNYRAEWFNIP